MGRCLSLWGGTLILPCLERQGACLRQNERPCVPLEIDRYVMIDLIIGPATRPAATALTVIRNCSVISEGKVSISAKSTTSPRTDRPGVEGLGDGLRSDRERGIP